MEKEKAKNLERALQDMGYSKQITQIIIGWFD
jgi:phage replication-related protein YjqB (UPF0714/DUF867 family)